MLDAELSSLSIIEKRYSLGLIDRVERVQELLSMAEESIPPEPDYDEDIYHHHGASEDWVRDDNLAEMFSTLCPPVSPSCAN